MTSSRLDPMVAPKKPIYYTGSMFWLLVVSLLIRVVSDLCFKQTVHRLHVASFTDFCQNFGSFFRRPIFWLALGLGVVMLISWAMALRYYDLSFAYPLFSLSYVMIMLAGSMVYHEKLDSYKVGGMACILVAAGFLIYGGLV